VAVKYRLYIDEVGNSDMGASADPNHRYLSLTGVVFELSYVDRTLFPELEALKRKYFGAHADEPVVLHRKELVNKKTPFEALNDPATEAAFNNDFLNLLRQLNFTVLTAVIDKLEQQQRYRSWRFDPYHYCLTVMVERYVLWLRQQKAQGDVMAESRGGKEDRRLKDSFERVCEQGSDFVPPDQFAAHLTSRQLKVKSKANNIAGLQIADIVAHPSFRATLVRREGKPLATNFGGQIAQMLEESKYHRNPAGVIEGWGRKWLP
jgi:hypothetical protein